MDNLLPVESFRLYGVSTRFPQKLSDMTAFQQVVPGVYEITWGSQVMRLIVLSQIREIPRNAVWQLFSANSQHVVYGASHYQWHIRNLSTILYDLLQQYRVEGITMPYTVNDYYRDFTREHIDCLTPEERLKGLPPEEFLKLVPPERRLKGLSPEEIIRALFSDEVKSHIPTEQLERLLEQLRHES